MEVAKWKHAREHVAQVVKVNKIGSYFLTAMCTKMYDIKIRKPVDLLYKVGKWQCSILEDQDI